MAKGGEKEKGLEEGRGGESEAVTGRYMKGRRGGEREEGEGKGKKKRRGGGGGKERRETKKRVCF